MVGYWDDVYCSLLINGPVQNCDNTDRRDCRYELVSLSGEYGKHLSNLVLNNVNHIHILLYDLIPTNLSYLSTTISKIRSLIKFCQNILHHCVKNIPSIKPFITNCKTAISGSENCLNQIKSSLQKLKTLLPDLYDSYGYINYLRIEAEKIIKSPMDVSGPNSDVYRLIKAFNCSLSEFAKIESLLNSTKSTIQEITGLKDRLLNSTNELGTQRMDSVYFQIKCCCDNIDRIGSSISCVEFYTLCLKYWICKFINLDISNNLLNRLLFSDKILDTDIDEICSYILSLHIKVRKIFSICNSKCKCQCTCKCVPECKGNTICLCFCECTKDVTNGFCICICKHKTCKCICICICKNGEQGCGSGEHECKKCLLKVDIGTLKDQTLKILNNLRFIRCYISVIEKKCCYCSCCVNGRCGSPCCGPCQSIINYYKSILSTMDSIELLFKEVSTEILKLAKLYKTVSLISVIATNCKKCNCKEKMDILIKHIDRSLHYYYLFGSRLDDIRSFVEYKINYSKSKQIIYSLQRSMQPLLNQLEEINFDIINGPNQNVSTNNTSLVQIDKLSMGVYSHYNIVECIFFVMRAIKWAEFINDFLNTNDIPDRCSCVRVFEWNNNFDKFYIEGYSDHTHKIDTSILSKLYKQTRENHICLCLVFKYVLYPSIMRSLYFVFGRNLEIHGSINRKFDNYNYHRTFNDDASKMLLFVFHIISVIINIISKDTYVKWNSPHSSGVEVKCFCMAYKYDKNYMISTILFLSSLIENTSSMDKYMFQVFVNHLSSFMLEFDIITNKNIKVELNDDTSITLTKSTSYFSSLAATDSKLRLTIGGSDQTIYSLNDKLEIDESFEEIYRYSISCNIKLFYQNFTFLSFYIFKNSKIIEKEKKIRRLNIRMSQRYLSITLKNGSVCDKDRCKGCKKFIYKILYYVICVAKGKFKTMSSQISNISIIKFINQNKRLELHEIINYLNRRTIDVTEMILRTSKLNLLTSSTNVRSINVESVTSVRNWGYDTRYEHDVTFSETTLPILTAI